MDVHTHCDKAGLSSSVFKTPKNYIDHWRHKVANDTSGNALFLQPNGKRITGRYVRSKLSPAGKRLQENTFISIL